MSSVKIIRKLLILSLYLTLAKANLCAANQSIESSNKTQISYCVTSTAINSLEEAKTCDYTKKREVSLDFTKKVQWLRIEVMNQAEAKEFVIKIEPFLVPRINVYAQDKENWKQFTTGSSLPINKDFVTLGGYRIPVPASQALSSTYYLAIHAPSFAFLSISVEPVTKVNALGLGMQLGLLIAILMFALVSYLFNKSIVMGRFSFFSLDILLCLLVGSGIVMQTWLPNHPELNLWLFHRLLDLRIALWLWVTQGILKNYQTPPWFKSGCYAFYGLVLLEIGMDLSPILFGPLLIAAALIQIVGVHQTRDIPALLKKLLMGGVIAVLALFFIMLGCLLFLNTLDNKAPLHLTRLTDLVIPLVMLGIITYQGRSVYQELNTVKLALNEAKLKAEYESKLLSDRQTLIDMLAHELKNPLTSISLAVDNLQDTDPANLISAKRRITNINRSIKDMDEIIERCNLMNTLDNKEIGLEKSTLVLKKFLGQIVTNLEGVKQVDIVCHPDILVFTDAKFLKVIFSNLLQNALKYAAPASKIQVNVKQSPKTCVIRFNNEVSSNMIPEESRIFERFYRHPMAHNHRGAGLGLYLTREMCRLLGGSIYYSYDAGIAKFTVELPNKI